MDILYVGAFLGTQFKRPMSTTTGIVMAIGPACDLLVYFTTDRGQHFFRAIFFVLNLFFWNNNHK